MSCSQSLGSDTGDHIRRAVDSPPVNLGQEILGLEIPAARVSGDRTVGSAYSVAEIGSAHSAYNGSSHGSQNGNSG